MEDAAIVELYLARDEAAIRHTAEKYGGRLRGLANRILNDSPAAEECENDTYLAAWRLIPPHEPRTYLFAFLGKITRHLAIDACRRRSAEKRSVTLCELTAELEECLPALEQAISGFLGGCTAQQQRMFVRRYWYFDSVAAIAEACGCTQSKVKVTLYRMRGALKDHLEREGFSV